MTRPGTDTDPVGPSPLDRTADAARRQLADHVDATPPPFADLVARRRHRQRRRAFVGATVVVAVAAMAGGAALLDDDRDSNRDREAVVADDGAPAAPSNANADLLAPGSSEVMPPAPIAGRGGAAYAWSGTELLIWGGVGQDFLADGAAYDPRGRTWRILAPSPLAARHHPATAWTGDELVVWGGSGSTGDFADGAAYDPATDTWRTLAAAPIDEVIRPTAVWTGRELIVVGGIPEAGRAAAYDPVADTWRSLELPPGANTTPWPQATWTGTEAVFVLDVGPSYWRVVAALDPDEGTWRLLPRVGVDHQGLYRIDGAVFAVNPRPDGVSAVLDPGATEWRPFSATPSAYLLGSNSQDVQAGDLVLSWVPTSPTTMDLRALDLRTGAWSSTPVEPALGSAVESAAVWADGVAIAWGGYGNGAAGTELHLATGVVARPLEPVATAPPPEPLTLPTPTTPGPYPRQVMDDDSEMRGTIDQYGEPATWDGRLLPVLPVHDDAGELAGYWGCRFLERDEVERDDFAGDPSCNTEFTP